MSIYDLDRVTPTDLGGGHQAFPHAAGVLWVHPSSNGQECQGLIRTGVTHWLTGVEPLTIRPSVLCPNCGRHGFIEYGMYHDA